MKELSIEEKAKAYDEALERAEKALEVLGTDKCEGARQILSLFPELCESENEKIRRALMKFIEKIPYERLENDGVSVKDALAWLEKQGEQKPQRMISAEAKEAMYDKPAWSEEDEKEYKYALKFVDNILNNCGNKKDYDHSKRCYDWLKSLKDKIKGE